MTREEPSEVDVRADGFTPIRSCAPRWIHRVSPSAMIGPTWLWSSVTFPVRSHPDRANTPGCSALYMASRRCPRRMAATSSSVAADGSATPCVAAMMDAVVHAMPFWVNTRL